jgi:hypothetical protein
MEKLAKTLRLKPKHEHRLIAIRKSLVKHELKL